MGRVTRWLSILMVLCIMVQTILPGVAAADQTVPAEAEVQAAAEETAAQLQLNQPVYVEHEQMPDLYALAPQGNEPEEPAEALAQEDAEQVAAAEEILPEEEIPGETAPEEIVPEQTLPEETTPEETVPEETLPEETVPEETVPEETVPEETEPEKPVTIHNVPLYFQTDYPDTMYGAGTVATSGCSITCLAMVATYMTGHSYLPDQLARYFGGRAVNNMARMEHGSNVMQLPYSKNTNWHETLAALENGKIAIVLLNEKSAFTASQHFVVLTGITEDGKVLVNDPYLPNYGRPELERGFVDGFAPGYLSNGYEGGWVYDVDAMPEEPFLYYEEEPELPEPRYPELKLTAAERELLAKVVWVESRGESFEGQQAVAEVVFNRMMAEGFSDTLAGVIYAPGQFRSVDFLEDAEPYQTQYEAIERALYGPYVLPEDVFYFATFQTNDNVWGKIGGHIFCYR